MGSVVLHIDKAFGNDAAMTAHIERTIDPKNADQTRTHLNEDLVPFPNGVENRTQAIQHRLDNAGLTRKIGTNQVRALRVMLSGTPEDMERIEATGKLGEWCEDSVKWMQGTFGKDNLVSAVLHMDEKTPHIHATVVPIVTGERRKAQAKPVGSGKKQYRKKNPNAARLCADDVMTRDNLKSFQDTYAEAMAKYGLQRGIDGSEARHITTQQYYRDLYSKNEDLKEGIEYLEGQKHEVNEKIRDLYDRKDEAQEKFLNMHDYAQQKETEISALEARLAQHKKDFEPYKAQDDLNLLLDVFPKMNENLRIAQLCKDAGLTVDTTKQLFKGEAITVNGKLHSPEHNRSFNVKDAKLQLFNEKGDTYKFRLNINGQNIIDWFKEQFGKLRQAVRPHVKPITPTPKKGRGV